MSRLVLLQNDMRKRRLGSLRDIYNDTFLYRALLDHESAACSGCLASDQCTAMGRRVVFRAAEPVQL
jgi:hypothetical protein